MTLKVLSMKNTVRLCAVAVAFFSVQFLAGCASDDAQVFSPYMEETFRAWQGAGPSNLDGQAFYKMPSGRLVSCAGSKVTLLPANGYNVEALQSIGAGKGMPVNYNRSALKFSHTTMCDGSGRFSFQKLPNQNWIVLINLSWQEKGGATALWSKEDKGGSLYQEILLEPGDNKIVLSNPDFVADQP